MGDSNGYGNWTPGLDEFLARVRGRVQRVVQRTERWEGGIHYEVRVQDPDIKSAIEEDEDTRSIWACDVDFIPGVESPMHACVEAAREQERISDEDSETIPCRSGDLMPPSRSIHEALLRRALGLLARWKDVEQNQDASEEDFSAQWHELSEDVSVFIELCNDAGVARAP